MGVPHPPGAPLFLLFGRLFSLLPTATDIGLRVNLLSCLVSAFTVLLLYLCIVRLARAWRGVEKTVTEKIAVYGSAAIGTLCFAFSHSFWFNAVEAEVYAMSMFFTALVFYLGLRWLDHADKPQGNRILLLIFYIIGLSSGVHLLSILALISVSLIIAFRKFGVSFKVFLLGGLFGSIAILAIYPGIIQGFPLLIERLTIWSVVLITAAMVWGVATFIRKDRRIPAMALLSALLVMLGYSTFLMIKIRSGANPFLDENDPETWGRLLSYLNREQYGSESLFLTMFHRKADFWSYQINQMYLRYLGWQFLNLKLFYGIPFALGIIGAFHQFYRDKKGGLVVLALFLMTGLAVILYLNQENPQPRERDYAYVGSFFVFAIWIGLGVLALIESFTAKLTGVRQTRITAGIVILLLLIAPVNMLAKGYHSHDRGGNYIAWDYSYNLLVTCAPDAILYTNGDNDTFPVWYLQEVAGVRRDVRIVNLSLLNTGWFIQQIRDKNPKVAMTAKVTDEYLNNVVDARDVTGLMDRRWQQKRKVKVDGPNLGDPPLIWDVAATMSYPWNTGQTEYFLRVQDIMILNNIVANRWQKPIYFAVTVSEGNLMGLHDVRNPAQNYMSMEGLAFRLYPHPVPLIDPDKIADNMLRRYKYRNTDNPKVYYDDNIERLLGNYRQGLIQLAYNYLSVADSTGTADIPLTQEELAIPLQTRIDQFDSLPPKLKALTALDFMVKIVPEDVIPITYEVIGLQIARLYAQLGRPEMLSKQLDRAVQSEVLEPAKAYEYGIYYLSEANEPAKARQLFDQVLQHTAAFENYQRIAMTWIQYAQDTASAASTLRGFLTRDDSRQARVRVASQGLAMGLHNLAFSIYEQLLQDDPNDGEAVRGMVDYYRATGNLKRALEMADNWLASHPGDPTMTRKRVELAGLASGSPATSGKAR
jgi:tetratricopeptide (TPR) repeat protein